MAPELNLFSWQDYAVFASMLVVSAATGLYYGCIKKHPKTDDVNAEEFLIGGGKLSTFPVGLSLLAGFLSSITLLAQPAEAYLFGPQIWLFGFGSFIIIPIVNYIVIPFFRGLDTTSIYEYFGKRYHRSVQLLASVIFTLQVIVVLALVMYAPSLALHQVTGINITLVVTAMFIVCLFYTTLGGMRATVTSDTFQVLVLYSAMTVVLYQGTSKVGGIGVVFQRNSEHERYNFFDPDPDPTLRYSVWSVLIGGGFLHLALFSGNQFQIQRFSTVSSTVHARRTVWIYAVGWGIATIMTAYCGMLIFATYYDCDPLSSNAITTADHIFPFFVMDVLGDYKGIPGLFVAGIFSAGLSTVSAGVNSLAAIWFGEMEGTQFKKTLTSMQAEVTVKLIALAFGLLSFGIVFLVPYMGPLVQITLTLNGYVPGALAGIFALGHYVPISNSWGAAVGLVSSISIVSWMTIGAQFEVQKGHALYQVLPLSIEACASNTTSFSSVILPPAPAVFRVSFLWYSLIAFSLSVVIGTIVSLTVRYVQYIKANPRRKTPRARSDCRASPKERNGFLLQSQGQC